MTSPRDHAASPSPRRGQPAAAPNNARSTGPTISLRTPDDLAVSIPYLLGFHPSESVVIAAMKSGALLCTARVDLPPPGVNRAKLSAGLQRSLVAPLARHAPDVIAIIVYAAAAPRVDVAVLELSRGFAACGVGLLGAVQVADGHVRDAEEICDVPAWSEWRPLPHAHDVAAVAEFVGLGVNPLLSRDQLIDEISLAPEPDRVPALELLIERCLPSQIAHTDVCLIDRWSLAWSRLLSGWALPQGSSTGQPRPTLPGRIEAVAGHQRVDVTDAVEALASLRSLPFRDALLGWLCPGLVEDDTTEQAERVALAASLGGPTWRSSAPWQLASRADNQEGFSAAIRALLANAPPTQRAPLLTVLATLAWAQGDGARANVAVEAALKLEPEHPLARRIDHVLQTGMPPLARAG